MVFVIMRTRLVVVIVSGFRVMIKGVKQQEEVYSTIRYGRQACLLKPVFLACVYAELPLGIVPMYTSGEGTRFPLSSKECMFVAVGSYFAYCQLLLVRWNIDENVMESSMIADHTVPPASALKIPHYRDSTVKVPQFWNMQSSKTFGRTKFLLYNEKCKEQYIG